MSDAFDRFIQEHPHLSASQLSEQWISLSDRYQEYYHLKAQGQLPTLGLQLSCQGQSSICLPNDCRCQDPTKEQLDQQIEHWKSNYRAR